MINGYVLRLPKKTNCTQGNSNVLHNKKNDKNESSGKVAVNVQLKSSYKSVSSKLQEWSNAVLTTV